MTRQRNKLIQRAYDELDGNLQKAQVIATLAVADALMELAHVTDRTDTDDALKDLAVQVGGVAIAIGEGRA